MSQKLKLEDVITQVSIEEECETDEYQHSFTQSLIRKVFCCFPRSKSRPKKRSSLGSISTTIGGSISGSISGTIGGTIGGSISGSLNGSIGTIKSKKRKKEPSFSNIFKISNSGIRIETDDDEMVLMDEEEEENVDTTLRNKNLPGKKKKKGDKQFGTQSSENISDRIGIENIFPIDSLLGPPIEAIKERKTLVLDLDETLVHSSFKKGSAADIVVHIEIESFVNPVYVLKRPGVDEFLRTVGEMFEIVVFTASLSKYANPLLDQLDRDKVIHHRLFREHCTFVDGAYKKDLSKLGRDVSQVIIIDNSPICYDLHPQNAIPVSTWIDDRNDRELFALVPWLQRISQAKDVYGVLSDLQSARMKFAKTRVMSI